MSVVTAIEETGPCSRKLTIEVPAEAVDAEMGRVVGKFRKSLNLPGFRRGKVPVSLVHKRFREEIRQEVIDRLLPRYWRQARAEKDLEPMLPPEIEELELEPGQPMTVVASIDTRPEVRLQDFRNFDLPAKETEPSAEEVDEQLDQIRRRHAEWTVVERPASRGDVVIGQMTPDGAEAGSEQPFRVEVGGEGVDEELTLTLTGMSAGGTAELPSQGEDDAPGRQLEVFEVREQELPALDDDFAANFDLESVDELRQKVEEEVGQAKMRQVRQQREHSMLEQLRQRHPLELPGRVVKHQNERMLQDYAEQLASRGVDVEKADIDWVAISEQLQPEAQRRVHDELLLDAVADAEDILVDENEFERFLSAASAQQQMPSMALRKQLSDSGRLESLRAQMRRARTVRFLLGEEEPEAES